jgi:divalent metal cation (Fe/Co/Zn/Cd) transporter
VKTGWEIFREAAHNLTDGFDKGELDNMTKSIKKVSGVRNVKDIRARIHGNNILLDVIVGVSADLTVLEGHIITEKIEENLRSEFNITEAIVHVEPEI